MIFTYDEGGGFYDHVAAQPAPAPDQYTYPIDLEATDKCDGADDRQTFANTSFEAASPQPSSAHRDGCFVMSEQKCYQRKRHTPQKAVENHRRPLQR